MARNTPQLSDYETEDGLIAIEAWAREGLTDKQIAEKKIGIGETTFWRWKTKSQKIVDALKKGKAPCDAKVENALYKRAQGYEYEEVITELYDMPDGTQRKHVRKIKKHMPPDVTAIIYWLKNRRPDLWRDRPLEPKDTSTLEALDSVLKNMGSVQ